MTPPRKPLELSDHEGPWRKLLLPGDKVCFSFSAVTVTQAGGQCHALLGVKSGSSKMPCKRMCSASGPVVCDRDTNSSSESFGTTEDGQST